MIDLVIEHRRRDLGGFEVGRLLPYAKRRMIGPFIFFDHMGPVEFPRGIPREVDVRPHPHIGLSTITYLFAGEIMHRDSIGSEQAILPGEVNWMTAGSGITHSERFEHARREGGPMDGIQAWVALPTGEEEIEPSFAHHEGEDLPHLDFPQASGRLIAGEAYGSRSAVGTHSPMFYVHWEAEPGARIPMPVNYPERACYVAHGAIEVDGRRFTQGEMIVFSQAAEPAIASLKPSTLMCLGGEPVGERHIEWNFVSSSLERIEQAKADWRAGRIRLPDADNQEFIPLPGDPPPPPNPMS
jgi:hypothetical protein